MAWVEDLKAVAMYSVISEGNEYVLRNIFRWYSKEFATPLHIVESLPLDDVLRHYYEVHFSELNDQERAEEIDRILLTEEKLRQRKTQEDADDADAYEFGKAAEQAEKIKEQKKAKEKKPDPPSAPASLPDVSLKDLKELPPDIDIKFIDSDDEIESMLNGSFGPPSKKNG